MSDDNNTKLNNIAQRVMDNIEHNSEDEKFGSVVTVLVIISIILTLIRVIQECNKPILKWDRNRKMGYFKSEIQNRSFKNNWYTKRIIKKTIRDAIGNDNYKIYGTSIMNGLLKSGENITDDESLTLMEVANV